MLLSSVTLKKVKEGEVTARNRPALAARHTLRVSSKYSQEFSCSQLAQQAKPAAATALEETRQVNKPKVRGGIFSKIDMI